MPAVRSSAMFDASPTRPKTRDTPTRGRDVLLALPSDDPGRWGCPPCDLATKGHSARWAEVRHDRGEADRATHEPRPEDTPWAGLIVLLAAASAH